jgi:hypothetical protein
MTVLRMGTTGRIGLLAAYLSVWDRDSTALRVSMATWITASTRIMDTTARCPDVVRSNSIISRRMRLVTVAATWSQHQATMAAENAGCLGSAVVVDAAREDG